MKTNKQNKQAPAILSAVIVPEIQRPVSAVLAEITFDGEGNATLKKGSNVTWQEIALASAEKMHDAESASIRAANVLRLARMLPAVKQKDKDGAEKEIPAFDMAAQGLRAALATESTYYNVLGMVAAVDVKEQYKLPVSAFAVKESLGTLRRFGVLPKGDGKALPPRLTNGEGGKAAPLIKALKDGKAPVNALRAVLDKLNNRPAKKKGASNPAAPASEKEIHNPAKLERDLITLAGEWEKTSGFHGVDKVRTPAIQFRAYVIAKLAGLDVKEVKEPAPAPAAEKK